MGNSTITVQKVMDKIAAIGDLQTVFDSTGGWADEPALTIANDVMQELISLRFPWKWNRLRVNPFILIPCQQDYATLTVKTIGWLESAVRIDINSTAYPPPSWPIIAVRDLPMESRLGPFPYQVSWHYNRDMEQHAWPGPLAIYPDPIGKYFHWGDYYYPTNIRDADGNILVLTQFGTTGLEPPIAPRWEGVPVMQPKDWPVGQTIIDGSCVWTVADPDAQGFRFRPAAPRGGNVWLIRIFAQKKAPRITTLGQTIDPIPDDEEKWFKDGCIAYAHRYSATPQVKARYAPLKAEWIAAMQQACVKNDREDEEKGFYPDRSIMSPSYINDPGPFPYRWGWSG